MKIRRPRKKDINNGLVVDYNIHESRHITNFTEDKLDKYILAIAKWNKRKTDDDKRLLFISEGTHNYEHALYVEAPNAHCDLSDFWRIFEEL